MSLAERTRKALKAAPFIHEALRAGVVSYTAAARYLDVKGDTDAIASAIRRYTDALTPPETGSETTVRMERGVQLGSGNHDDGLLTVGDVTVEDGGECTAYILAPLADQRLFGSILTRLAIEGVPVRAAGVSPETAVIVVGSEAGPEALRIVEDATTGPRPGE